VDRIHLNIRHVPDSDVERYFKAGDVLVLPYRSVFQSGVLFLAYSFGLPVIATDVGSLKEEVIEGETGSICRPGDVQALAQTIERYFESNLFRNLESQRGRIKQFANERYSWDKVAELTRDVYSRLLSSDPRAPRGCDNQASVTSSAP
jgi:D-inositol-3-phosphate glycosyltransferase